MTQPLPRQISLFLFVGLLQLLLDWAVFVFLSANGVLLILANVTGRLAGATIGFWLNGRFTFAHNGRPRLSGIHLRRFIIAWLLMTLTSTVLLQGVAVIVSMQSAWLAKPIVEAAMAVLSFVVWRHWVFR